MRAFFRAAALTLHWLEHDLRANAFAFVARENRCTLFRIVL